jgi:hypothetical protein
MMGTADDTPKVAQLDYKCQLQLILLKKTPDNSMTEFRSAHDKGRQHLIINWIAVGVPKTGGGEHLYINVSVCQVLNLPRMTGFYLKATLI